jgi:hypothetical protein
MTGALQEFVRGVYGVERLRRMPLIIATQTSRDGYVYFCDDGTRVELTFADVCMLPKGSAADFTAAFFRRWREQNTHRSP